MESVGITPLSGGVVLCNVYDYSGSLAGTFPGFAPACVAVVMVT